MREAAALYVFAVGAAALAINARQRRRAAPIGGGLSAVYRNLRVQANEKAEGWPHADAMRSKLVEMADWKDSRLQPPEFSDGHGPIGAYSMFRSVEQLRVLRFCKQAFDRFLDELKLILTPEQQPEFERLLWVNAERSYHTCVSVFHEHPSLLTSEADQAKWRPVQGELLKQLAAALRQTTAKHNSAPTLTLDSLCVTADGAFIVGFVDDERGTFAALRESTAACAKATIGGELTSRPKSLIHVTLGRILGMPAGLSAAQRARIAALVREYNDEVLPRLVASADCPRVMRVGGLSLVRDRVWWMTEYDEYDEWSL